MASAQQLRRHQGRHDGVLIMPIALLPHEAVAIAAICKALRGSNLQVRRPSYTYPSFWSRPLYRTAYRAINANSDWQDLVIAQGQPQYIGIIQQYVATSLGSLALAGLEFRILKDGSPLDVSMAPGVEFNKDGPNTYPIVPRDIFLPVNETETVALQVRNPTAVQRIAIGLFGGWYIDSRDSTVTSSTNAVVDSVYTPMVGVPYGDQ
jgi:hypothetical protein